MTKALAQAKRGRLHILSIMNQTISKPVSDISEFAPKILVLRIDVDKIGALIGPGGKNIKALCEQFSVTINTDNDGTVTIYGRNSKDTEAAKDAVLGVVLDPVVGTMYNGVVKRIMEFGAFVEILPGKEGLVHISRLSRQRIVSVTDVLKEGQEIPVKLLELDKMGRLNLSYIDAIDDGGGEDSGDSHSSHDGGSRDGDGHSSRDSGSRDGDSRGSRDGDSRGPDRYSDNRRSGNSDSHARNDRPPRHH
jgi:polyribonucleotide nucleotidyltransferase